MPPNSLKGIIMNKKLTRTLFAGMVLLATSAAWADTQVQYDKPDQFTDLPFDQSQRDSVLKDLTAHFEQLGKKLPAGQNLQINITDIDLAGREDPRLRGISDIRVMNGRVDWPRIRLHYVLEQNGKVISSADSSLSDMSYLSRINRYSSGDRLRYEKLMIDDWFTNTFGIDAQAKR